jgi:2-(1,2-epoxy-1,2-dihydrophenyl)acetyl-CoA isomerase
MTTSGRSGLRVEADRGVVTLALARTDSGNALDLPTAVAFADAVAQIERDGSARVVVLAAEGRLFCVGGDVRAMAAASNRAAFLAELASTMHRGLIALRDLPVPVVAQVQGPAAGAGVGLVLAADIAVAAESATFVLAYSEIGLSPDCGVTALLPAAVGPRRAALLTLTNPTLSASDALEAGLVSEVRPVDNLAARVREVVDAVTSRPRQAIGETARLLRLAGERTYPQSLADEAVTIARLSGTNESIGLVDAFASRAPRQASGHP